MKKKLIIIVSTFVLVTVFGIGLYKSNASQAEPNLSSGEIKALVSSQYPGEITELELDKDLNKAVYEVEIVGDGKEYELKLDGNTGEVLKLKEKQMDVTKTPQNKQDTVTQKNKGNKGNKAKGKQQNFDTNTNMDICKAAETAMQNQSGTLEEIELEHKNGQYQYEAKIRNEHEKVKIKMNAETGEIIDEKVEKKDHPSKKVTQVKKQGNAAISLCDAAKIATQEYPGIVEEVELDYDDGQLVYEVKIQDNQTEVDMEIDALTGEILVIEIDD